MRRLISATLIAGSAGACASVEPAPPASATAVDAHYVQCVLVSDDFRKRISALCGGTSGGMKNISKPALLSLLMPLPQIGEQRSIVAKIEAEQALVAANRDLIARFEKKIEAAINRVLGDDHAVIYSASADESSGPRQAAE